MISSKEELKRFLISDKKNLGKNRDKPSMQDFVWKYEIALRKCEYYTNCGKGLFDHCFLKYWKTKKMILGRICGFTIPINVFDEGLSIAHMGNIIINGDAKVGKNCRIHVGVNIGTLPGENSLTPVIGDNCYIGPGAKIFGNIRIGNGVAIGANAVVCKSCLENDVTLLGVPAKIYKEKGSKGFIINYPNNN